MITLSGTDTMKLSEDVKGVMRNIDLNEFLITKVRIVNDEFGIDSNEISIVFENKLYEKIATAVCSFKPNITIYCEPEQHSYKGKIETRETYVGAEEVKND